MQGAGRDGRFLLLLDSMVDLFIGLLSYQNFIEIMMETMQTMTHWGKLKTVLEGYVGFDTVQEQIRKKSLKRGFEFNLMVVGKFQYIIFIFLVSGWIQWNLIIINIFCPSLGSLLHVPVSRFYCIMKCAQL